MRELSGKTVLVTGAGRGIGKRIALSFAAQGARVGLVARSVSELHAAQLEIEHAGGEALAIQADVRDYEQVSRAVECLTAQFGDIAVLVAAAGIQGPIGPFATIGADRWSDTLDTNIGGVMNVIRSVLPGMMERRSGKIIALAGGGAAAPRPNFSSYAASKAAVVRLIESIAGEVDGYNVQINSFGPGGAYTSMTDEILNAGDLAGAGEREDAEQVRQTGGSPADRQIAFALFLASDRSNHINGKMIYVSDDLKRLEQDSLKPDMYTLRRLKT